MINPVNSDKSITATTDKSGRSQASVKMDRVATSNTTQQIQTTETHRQTLDVENARQLYQMESRRMDATSAIDTPQQARSLLDSIVQQFTATPESAAKAQAAHVSTPITNLLEGAPA
ncbi:MAG: ribosome maturation factor rimM [Candidatus Thiodiazotropha sp.]